MKKTVLSLLLGIFTLSAVAQADLPYQKMLNMSDSDLSAAKFKYRPKRNCYILSKQSSFFSPAEVMAANQGRGLDKAPDRGDYQVIIQMGDTKQVASVEVIFFNDDTYMQLQDWLQSNADNYKELTSGNRTKGHATYQNYVIELIRQYVPLQLTAEKQESTSTTTTNNKNNTTTTTTDTTGGSKTVDGSYNGYFYIIHTGVGAASEKLDKANEKQQKRDGKGKKKSNVEDLM